MNIWNQLFDREGFRWREPHERMGECVELLRDRGFHRILDLGCGAGRHLVYLAKQEFEVYGIDISETGLEHARRWLARERLVAYLSKSDMTQIPFPDGIFDGLISLYVIHHNTLENMRKTVAEIHRVLRPGGLAFLTLLAKRNERPGQGMEIEPDTFIHDAGPDCGVPHHYSDRGEVEELLRGFRILKLDLAEKVDEEGRHSHWEVLVEKQPRQAGIDEHEREKF